MVFSYWHFQKVFTDVVLLSVLTAVIPYLYSAAAHLYWLLVKGRAVSWPHLARDLIVSTARAGCSRSGRSPAPATRPCTSGSSRSSSACRCTSG